MLKSFFGRGRLGYPKALPRRPIAPLDPGEQQILDQLRAERETRAAAAARKTPR